MKGAHKLTFMTATTAGAGLVALIQSKGAVGSGEILNFGCQFKECTFWEGFYDQWLEIPNFFLNKLGLNEIEYTCNEYAHSKGQHMYVNEKGPKYNNGQGWGLVSQIATLCASAGIPTLRWYLKKRKLKAKDEDEEETDYEDDSNDEESEKFDDSEEMTYHDV